MKIGDQFEVSDPVSGLRLTVYIGDNMNNITVEFEGESVVENREFWFDKEGNFDGMGSYVGYDELQKKNEKCPGCSGRCGG